MQAKLFAYIALVLMMISSEVEAVSLSSKTVVGNVLFEGMAVYTLAVIMLIVALMI